MEIYWKFQLELVELRRILEESEIACLNVQQEKLSTTHDLINVTRTKKNLEEQIQFLKQLSSNDTTKVIWVLN